MIDRHDVEGKTPEEVRPEVIAFKEEIAKVDGTLVSLRKRTSDGKKLYIATRNLQNPWEFYEENTAPGYYDVKRRLKEGVDISNLEPMFYGWEENSHKDGKPHMTGVMLVDVYTEKDGKIVPMGHMDWWLRNDYANGGGQMHQAAKPQTEHEEEAAKRWHKHDYTAFKVDYDYHKQGIGSLMIAVSAIALPAIGIKKFYTGGLLEPAVKTYEKFGVKEDDFEGRTFDRHLPIERLSQHPQVNKVITEFV